MQIICAESSPTSLDALPGTRMSRILERRNYGYRPDGNVLSFL